MFVPRGRQASRGAALSSVLEIGEALYISLNTIKTHVKSIFRKLDVATPPDAVSRARDLRLL
jgi:LuxR family maltose regulon positive regulatory protein